MLLYTGHIKMESRPHTRERLDNESDLTSIIPSPERMVRRLVKKILSFEPPVPREEKPSLLGDSFSPPQ